MQLLQPSISALLSGLGSALYSALFRVSGGHAAIGVLAVSISQSAAIAKAQTIQLPAFQQRGVRTTVVVPDRGSITLGGFSATKQSRVRIAPPFMGPLAPTRALRSTRGVGNMQMSVWIHDFQAMDAAILSEGRPTVATKNLIPRSNESTHAEPRPKNRLPAGN